MGLGKSMAVTEVTKALRRLQQQSQRHGHGARRATSTLDPVRVLGQFCRGVRHAYRDHCCGSGCYQDVLNTIRHSYQVSMLVKLDGKISSIFNDMLGVKQGDRDMDQRRRPAWSQ